MLDCLCGGMVNFVRWFIPFVPREISFAHNSCFSWPIALKFCTEHGSFTAVLFAKFQTDWTIKTDVMDERDFARFKFMMSFGRISYIAQHPWVCVMAWPSVRAWHGCHRWYRFGDVAPVVYPGMDLLPDTQNCELHMRRECRERFPRHWIQRKPLVNDPGMHHGTCVTHVPWCLSGSLTRGGGENIPGIPGACATRTYLVRGP